MNTTCPILDLPAVTAQPRTAAILSRQFGRPSVVLALLACLLANWLAPRSMATPPEVSLTRLHSFGDPPTGPVMPAGRMLEASDGMLYGATESGGQGHGTVFRMNKDGGGFIVLKSFANTEGSYPYAGVIEGSDGALYGTTYQGGGFGAGSAFRMKKDGTDFSILKSFAAADGANPSAGLVEGSDGALYGTTELGGDYGYGAVFRLNKDGTGFAVLKSFNNTDGARPLAAVTEGSDGALYSTTIGWGLSGSYGTVFRLNKDGSGFAVLKSFGLGADGSSPTAGVIEGSDGALYGATQGGVSGSQGSVFRMNKDGSGFIVLKTISDELTEGGRPYSGVTEGSDGALYGTTQGGGGLGGGTIFRLNRDGSGFSVLKHLNPATEGTDLYYGLTESSDGTLYGTGYQGGPANGGTVFRLNKDGSGFTILKTLDNWTDGSDPEAGVIEASDGALYGTTLLGGDSGFGTVFRTKKDGTDFTVLKSFKGTDGASPSAGLTEGSDGMLYGTTYFGGDHNYGTAFRMNKDGTGYTVLKSFNNTDGAYPVAAAIEGSDGAFYGTTFLGGAAGQGTVFRLSKDGSGFAVLKSFDLGADGSAPTAGVIEGSDGALYGATQGGVSGSQGSVFRINKDGSGFMVIKTFSNSLTEGGRPYSGVIEGGDGTLYGTTQGGGSLGGGTIFRLNRDGSGFAVLKHMDPATEGADLYYTLTENSDGALYGTAFVGGPSGGGSIFRINKDGSAFEVLNSPGAAEGEPRNFTCKLLHSSDGRWYGTTYLGGTANLGTIFAFQLDAQGPPPALESLTPTSAFANEPGFDLTVTGAGFLPGAVVYWNGSARPTTVVSGGELSAAIPAADLLTGVDIAVASVTVVNGDGQVSNPLGFSIVAQTVGTADAAVTAPGGTSTVSTAPTTSGEPGVSVTVQNGGDAPVTVLAATYDTRPVGETAFQVDNGSFVDVQVAGADEQVAATVFFYYPSTTTGGMENRVKLRYFDGASWIPVLSSGGLPPAKDTSNNLDGTVSGGRFTVVFDATSTPTIMELGGTVFGMIESEPQLGAITGPVGPVALGNPVGVTVNFAVVGDPADATVRFLWDDGTESIVAPDTATSATATHLYAAPGVYGVTVQVMDAAGDVGEGRFEYVVIYDPNGGFVTGGGWLDSAPGAYLYDPTLTGKATFGFNSKYLKGQSVPTGQTQFQFQAGDFQFHSTAYEWLVVAGAKAQYKGVGRVNGTGDYGFLLTATDGQLLGGGGVDKFRIKIWDRASGTVVYDNRRGASDDVDNADPQAIGGGSIVIQKGK